MERTCGKCKGQGGFAKRRTTNLNQFVSGDSGWVKCNVCSGSGVNPNYREKGCERCGRSIGYHKDAQYPPKYCSNCKSIVANEKQAKQQERERQNAKWREKNCLSCGTTIKYNTDWGNVPDYCKSCSQRELEKRCSVPGCDRTIKYKVSWNNIPDKCGRCRKEIESGKTARQCEKCRKVLFVPSGKSYTVCMDCNQAEQVQKHEQLRRSVPGRRISTSASSMDQFARSLMRYLGSEDVFFVELDGSARDTWKKPPLKRGQEIDKGFERSNLSYNFPVIDLWEESSGSVTSIKSMDLGAPTYRNTNSMDRQIGTYIEQLGRYKGTGDRGFETRIEESQIKDRTLLLVIPLIGSRDYQLNYIYSLPHSQYAAKWKVNVVAFIVD